MPSLSEYQTNTGAVHSIGWHIVWCPKYRRRVLVGPVEERLKELLHQKAEDRGWSIETLEVMPDHVRIFVRTLPDNSPSYVANQFKGYTSRILRKEFRHLKSRLPTLWTRSYFIASVRRVSESTIRKYIDEQKTRPDKGWGRENLTSSD